MINRIKNLNPILTILFALIIIFFPVLIGHKVLFYRDISIQYYPLTQYVVNSIKSGEFPLWNPYIFSGFEQLSGLEPPIFYPFNILNFIFPFHISIVFILIIHYFIAGFGMYLFCRYLNLSKQSSFIGALVFSLNGYMFELNSFTYLLYAVSWIPYILLFTNKFIDKQNLKDFLFLIFFSLLQISTGRLDYFYLTQILIWSWCIFNFFYLNKNIDYFESSKKYIYLACGFLIASIIMSVQIIPSLNFIKSTRRIDSMSLETATIWSLHPLQLLNLVFSNFFGDIIINKYITPIITDGKNLTFFIYNLYIGIPSSVLLFYGIKSKNKYKIFFILLSIFFILLSFGNYTFIYQLFFNYFPKFNLTRYPEKLFVYSLFSFSILISIGAEQIEIISKEKILKLFYIFNYILLFFLLFIYFFNSYITNYINIIYSLNLQNIFFILKSIIFSFIPVLIISVLLKYTKFKPVYIFSFIILLELTFHNLTNLWVIDKNDFYNKSELVNDIEEKIDDKNLYNILQDNESNVPSIDDSKIISDFKNNIFSANYNLSSLYKLHNSFGYYPGEPIKISMVNGAINDEIPGFKLSNSEKASLMRVMGIRFYIWHIYNSRTTPPDTDNFNLIKEYKKYGLQLWEVKNFQPRISFKSKALITTDENSILKALLYSSKYGLDKDTFLLYNNSDYRKAISLVKKEENKWQIQNVKIINENNNSITIEAKTNKSGYIILTNRYVDGWVAYVNGIEMPVLKANYYQQAVRIGSGYSHIELKYEPKDFLYSKYISLIGVIVFLILLFFNFLPKRTKNNMLAKDIPILIISALFIVSIIQIPTIINMIHTPDNMTFIGFDGIDKDVLDSDLFTYLSKMRQGYLGNLLYEDMYTLEKSYPTALFIIYLFIGNFARIFNLNIIFFYYISIIIFDLLLICQLIKLFNIYFTETKWKILALLLTTLSMGYSFIYLLFPKIADNISVGKMSADIIFPEFSLLTSMIDVCHFPLCISLMLIIFSKIIKELKTRKDAYITSITVFILAFIHPFDYVTVLSVSLSFIFLELYLKKGLKNYVDNIKNLLPLLTGLIPITYIYYVLKDNYVLNKTLKATNILLSPNISQYLMGYGTNIILCSLCLYFIASNKIIINKNIRFLIVWIIVNFILLYSPFDFQRRFMMGLQIPIVIMSVLSIKYLIYKKNLLIKYSFILLVFFTCFTTTSIILNSRAFNSTLYLPSDFYNLLEWIDKNNINNKNFLCLNTTAISIPSFTNNKVFVGHWSETIDFNTKKELALNFFKANKKNQKEIIKKFSIDYVVYGPNEKKVGTFKNNDFTTIYSIGDYDLIKVSTN